MRKPLIELVVLFVVIFVSNSYAQEVPVYCEGKSI